MPKRVSFKIDTTYKEQTGAGFGAFYLNQGEIAKREGVGQAVGCLFAPLGAALRGATRQEIEELIAISRTQLELYMNMALTRCQGNIVLSTSSKEKEDCSLEAGVIIDDFDDEKHIKFDDEKF